MVQDVSNRYIELLNQSASKLEKITNDANFAKNEHEEDTIANSNICLFVHIIKLIRESAKNWKKGPNHFLYWRQTSIKTEMEILHLAGALMELSFKEMFN